MADIELVIKIDEEDYKKVLDINNRECEWNNMHRCYEAVLNGTPIPDNATNGDYVKAIMKAGMIHSVLFEENAKVDDEEFVCMYYEGKIIGDFDLTWWNSPYQKGGKE